MDHNCEYHTLFPPVRRFLTTWHHPFKSNSRSISPSQDTNNPCQFSYHAEPSGTFYRYDAKAIGSGSEGAQAELQNEFHKSLTLLEAETLVLKTLKQVMEEKLDAKNVQLASVTREKGFRIYDDEEMAEVVGRLPTN